MYLFFNKERETFTMEKGRSVVTNIDRKGKRGTDTGGDKRKKMGKKGKGMILPGKHHEGEEEREFKLTN